MGVECRFLKFRFFPIISAKLCNMYILPLVCGRDRGRPEKVKQG